MIANEITFIRDPTVESYCLSDENGMVRDMEKFKTAEHNQIHLAGLPT
jgi:hypothetical protein